MKVVSSKPRLDLRSLMKKHHTDKGYLHGYDMAYEAHLDPLRDLPIRLLEIGIGGYQIPCTGGESLRMWAEYFPHAVITGIDCYDKSHVDYDRIRTFKGLQQDKDFLKKVSEKTGPFDVVIDDGSHIQPWTIVSFNVLFPLLKPGGLYVIEDLQMAYHPDFDGDYLPMRKLGSKPNTMALIMELIDGMNAGSWTGRSPSKIQKMVHSVYCARDIVFITKATDDDDEARYPVLQSGPTISVILPTLGRKTIEKTLESIRTQKRLKNDEVLVIKDDPPHGDWGCWARNEGIRQAKGDLIMFTQDDDEVAPCAFDHIREECRDAMDFVHMFRMWRPDYHDVLWDQQNLDEPGHISDQMVVIPNHDKSKIAEWTPSRYQCDFDFITETIRRFAGKVVWHTDVIAIVHPAGENANQVA